MNIIEALNWRYAVRQFSSKKIDEDKVQDLLTAVRLSATSYGLQPYRLIVVRDMEIRRKLMKYAMGQDKVFNCSHLIVFAAQTNFGDELIDRYICSVAMTRSKSVDELQGLSDHIKNVFSSMNESEKREWAHQQAYIALGTLLTTAAVMKIDTCPIAGFEPHGFDSVLGLAEQALETSILCPIGVRHPEDRNARLPKVRYSHSDMIMNV